MAQQPPNNQALVAADVEAIFRVCTFPRPDLQYGVGYSLPEDTAAVQNSMQSAFPPSQPNAPAPSDLSRLETLPAEVLFSVVSHLDILSVFRLRQTSRRMRALVTGHLQYQSIATYALPAMRALLRGRVADRFRLGDLDDELKKPRCGYCGMNFGGFLFLFDAKRCCVRCMSANSLISVLPPEELAATCGLTVRALKARLGLNSTEEAAGGLEEPEINFGRVARPRMRRQHQQRQPHPPPFQQQLQEQRSKVHVLRVHRDSRGIYDLFPTTRNVQSLLLMRDCISAVVSSPRLFHGMFQAVRPSVYISNAVVRFPFYEMETRQSKDRATPVALVYGSSCKGCPRRSMELLGVVGGTWVCTVDDLYTVDTYMDHFSHCRRAQYIWDASRGGAGPVLRTAFEAQGGYLYVDGDGNPRGGHVKYKHDYATARQLGYPTEQRPERWWQ